MDKLIYSYTDNLILQYSQEDVRLSMATHDNIDSFWKKQISQKKFLKNGQLLTLDTIFFIENTCILEVKNTNYAHYLYSLSEPINNSEKCRSLACNALLLTKDSQFVLGKMKQTTSLPGKIKFIGGSISINDTLDNTIFLEKCVLREVAEETGIQLDEKNRKPSYILTRNNFGSCLFLFIINLNLTREELKNIFDQNEVQDELEELVFVENQENKMNCFLTNPNNNFVEYLPSFFKQYYSDDEKTILSSDSKKHFI